MIGDIPAAICLPIIDAFLLEDLTRDEDVLFLRVTPHADHVRMLDEQETVGNFAGLAPSDNLPLQVPGAPVRDTSEVLVFTDTLRHARPGLFVHCS